MTVVTTAELSRKKAHSHGGLAGGNRTRAFWLLVAIVVLIVVAWMSIQVGARSISLHTIWTALWDYDTDNDEHIMIRELRVPRTLTGLIVGPALGVCGALIQAFTRNPLADPGILGVNAGASFAVTLAVGLLGITNSLAYVWFALFGAGSVTIIVYLLGSAGRDRATPAKLTLAGVALSAVLGGFTTALVLSSPDTFNIMRFWGVGSIGGRDMQTTLQLLPLILIGLVLGFIMARSLNILALGDDIASAMGVRTSWVRVGVISSVTLLAGTATALAGPIGFLGLMVPHVVRWFTGPDQRWILLFTCVVSPIFLIAADILGRIIMPNGELRVGLVTAIIGAPVLIILARRKNAGGL